MNPLYVRAIEGYDGLVVTTELTDDILIDRAPDGRLIGVEILDYVTLTVDGRQVIPARLDATERVRAEYQRFYDFVADTNMALVDAWHFTENIRKHDELRQHDEATE